MWQGQLEERTQLLGTEEESSDRHSSEEDNEADLETVYQITAEQKEYYIKQFRAIQPDLNGLLSGQAAKVFFEKSRIPVEELRHIWQLCDVTKDGALSLPEFAAAMHLVVLRRNNIPLPPILPECLVPSNNQFEVSQPLEGDLLHLDDDKDQTDEPTSIVADPPSLPFKGKFITRSHQQQSQQSATKPIGKHTGNSPTAIAANKNPASGSNKGSTCSNSPIQNELEHSPTKPNKMNASKEWLNQSSKEWTKFTESPTSSVSSPKPVNFDMQRTAQAVVSDPQILHPVPLRITPVGADNNDDDSNRLSYQAANFVTSPSAQQPQQQRKSDATYDGGIITIRDAESSSSPKQHNTQRDSLQNDLRAIQRPQPKKIQVKSNIGAIPPPPQRESLTTTHNNDATDSASNAPVLLSKKEKGEVPPPPPPR